MSDRFTALTGTRMTKVGLWFVLFLLVVGMAASNTGNNALYMVVATMASLVAVSAVVVRVNVSKLELEITPPEEIFANSPFTISVEVSNRSRLLPRFLLVLGLDPISDGEQGAIVVERLARAGRSGSSVVRNEELLIHRRGRCRIESARVLSLFPIGLFRRAIRVPVSAELTVFPELFPAASLTLEHRGELGSKPRRKVGSGHDLHSLRSFRRGDDPRSIHWKQSARNSRLIFMQRQAEESRRLSVILDNGTGPLREADKGHFEHLVSEAATLAVDHLNRGFEVELVTRDDLVHFGSGPGQRVRILETLALLGTTARSSIPLRSHDPHALQLRLAIDSVTPEPPSLEPSAPVPSGLTETAS